MYQHYGIAGLFTDSNGCVTPFVRWIEDYPLLDGLKMPPYVGSYDVKGAPDNYLHLFKGAIIISDNSNTDIESFFPSPIPNKDSDPLMEEIDLSFNPDDPMPPGIEEDDDDSERNIPILE
nr:reverse transcriptase domain-containing protein [Tanacetum cinerariifolium]